MAGFFEEFSRGFADAIADIREKVVEEPWFGRVVTERGEAAQWPEAREAEPQHEALSGEILGPEAQPTNTRNSAGLLEHSSVVDARATNSEPSGQWPQAREPQEHEHKEPEQDIDR